jgi:hypothetical protein
MSNNRMWLVNRRTGDRILLATYHPGSWGWCDSDVDVFDKFLWENRCPDYGQSMWGDSHYVIEYDAVDEADPFAVHGAEFKDWREGTAKKYINKIERLKELLSAAKSTRDADFIKRLSEVTRKFGIVSGKSASFGEALSELENTMQCLVDYIDILRERKNSEYAVCFLSPDQPGNVVG